MIEFMEVIRIMTTTDIQVSTSSAKFLEEERLSLLSHYNPNDHMVSWPAKDAQGRSTTVHYYPAAWRLYELSLRYPNANFKTEIVSMNEEKDTVIVKAYLFIGPDYATSERKAEAFKQGRLSQLDRVETKAMARAARNLGIGTERALDMDDAEGDLVAGTTTSVTPTTNGNHKHVVEAGAAPKQLTAPTEAKATPAASGSDLAGKDKVVSLYNSAYKRDIIATMQKWQEFKTDMLGQMVPDERVTNEQYDVLKAELKRKEQAASGK